MADTTTTYAMKGRLTFSQSGWLLLEVPNDIGNGLFKALSEHGIEQPISETHGRYNAHVSVLRPDEVTTVGGPDMIKARGQTIGFNLGNVRAISNPGGWAEVSKVWVAEVKSPELMKLRKSLGLGEPKYPFHMTFAIRKKNALVTKAASIIHFQKIAAQNTEIKPSPIEGKGLFATANFQAGDVIHPHFMTKSTDADGRLLWDQSEQCRFTNHGHPANCIIVPDSDYVKLVADRDIVKGEELTGDYDTCRDATLGPHFAFTYRGKPYRGESSTKLDKPPAHPPVTQGILRTLSGKDAEDPGVGRGRTVSDHHTTAGEDEWDDHSAGGDRLPEADPAGRAEARPDHPQEKAAGDLRLDVLCAGDTPAQPVGVLQHPVGGALGAGIPGDTRTGVALPVGLGGDNGDGSGCSNKAGSVSEWLGRRNNRGNAELLGCGLGTVASTTAQSGGPGPHGNHLKEAVNRNHLLHLRWRRGECLACGKQFKEDEYPESGVCKTCPRVELTDAIVKSGMALTTQIANARKATATPTEAQAAAGNYAKGKIKCHGFTISLENPKGSTRSGTNKAGKKWSNTMTADYGYILGTMGKDGDHVDVFIGPDPETEMVFVVDQHNPDTGKFDEHKVVFGHRTEAEARECYLSNYAKGWQGLKNITPLTMRQFRWWLEHGDQHKPVDGIQVKTASDSIYLNAINQTPLHYDPQAGIMGNVVNHLGNIKARGDRTITEAGSRDRLENAMNPNRSTQQLLAYLSGQRQPIVNHPLDRLISGEGSLFKQALDALSPFAPQLSPAGVPQAAGKPPAYTGPQIPAGPRMQAYRSAQIPPQQAAPPQPVPARPMNGMFRTSTGPAVTPTSPSPYAPGGRLAPYPKQFPAAVPDAQPLSKAGSALAVQLANTFLKRAVAPAGNKSVIPPTPQLPQQLSSELTQPPVPRRPALPAFEDMGLPPPAPSRPAQPAVGRIGGRPAYNPNKRPLQPFTPWQLQQLMREPRAQQQVESRWEPPPGLPTPQFYGT